MLKMIPKEIIIIGNSFIMRPKIVLENNNHRPMSLESRLSARSVLLPVAEVSTGHSHPL